MNRFAKLSAFAFFSLGAANPGRSQGPEVVQTNHVVQMHQQAFMDQPHRIVVEMPAPKVEIRQTGGCTTSCDDRPGHKCSLFSRKSHHNGRQNLETGALTSGALLMPLNLMAPESTVIRQQVISQPATQSFNFDLSGVRHAHEMEEKLATLAAYLNAKRAVDQVESAQIASILERMRTQFGQGGTTPTTGGGGRTGEGNMSLNEALEKINKRLDTLEQLVTAHHAVIKNLHEKDIKGKQAGAATPPEPKEAPPGLNPNAKTNSSAIVLPPLPGTPELIALPTQR